MLALIMEQEVVLVEFLQVEVAVQVNLQPQQEQQGLVEVVQEVIVVMDLMELLTLEVVEVLVAMNLQLVVMVVQEWS
tara:strand:- start:93 stop:323 length:231 start_codon:yes stop_codon:yes gene_type:complete